MPTSHRGVPGFGSQLRQDSSFLLMCIPWNSGDCSSSCVSATHSEDLDWAPYSQLQPEPALAIRKSSGEWISRRALSLSLLHKLKTNKTSTNMRWVENGRGPVPRKQVTRGRRRVRFTLTRRTKGRREVSVVTKILGCPEKQIRQFVLKTKGKVLCSSSLSPRLTSNRRNNREKGPCLSITLHHG